MSSPVPLSISDLLQAYREGSATPRKIISETIEKCRESDPGIWIYLLSEEEVIGFVERIEEKGPEELPLFGIPFAIKDNIDLAGVPTTAACPDFAYTPEVSAPVVELLIEAGAIPIGKTNMDQFATGLVGVRSPYGFPLNPWNPDFVPGGSSSGSAVAVASGLAAFALGTDTAGSGRVPASLNNLVGVKPTRGLVSCRGVVPACRSLDCVTVFTSDVEGGSHVLSTISAYDHGDAYSRVKPDVISTTRAARIGVPPPEQLEFFGNGEAAALFDESVSRCRKRGWEVVAIDMEPLLEAARLLYEGPWVAERFAAIESFLCEKPDSVFPVTRSIIEKGQDHSAADTFRAIYQLRELKRKADSVWSEVDAVMTPTIGAPFTVSEVQAEPVLRNSDFGYYTNFMNLLDYAAVAFPAGFLKEQGMPWGVTLFAPAFQDDYLLSLAGRMMNREEQGETSFEQESLGVNNSGALSEESGETRLAVCGAHLSGLPLNHQLTSRGGRLLESTETAPSYRMFVIPPSNGLPERPGLIRDKTNGVPIEVEVWSIPTENFGSFVDGIPAPLGIGKILLSDRSEVSGFLCEGYVTSGCQEISELRSWRTFCRNNQA